MKRKRDLTQQLQNRGDAPESNMAHFRGRGSVDKL